MRSRIRNAANALAGNYPIQPERVLPAEPERFLHRQYVDYLKFDRTARSRQSLLDCVETGCRVLDELKVDYWIARGTLLGWHRDGDFLPGDIDVDIGLYSEKHVFEIIRAMPYKMMGILTHEGTGAFQQLYFLDERADIIFDLWIYHDNDDQVVSRLSLGSFSLPKSLLSNRQTIAFEGRDYPIPDPDAYCAHWYGPLWRQPKHYGDESMDWVPHYERDCQAFKREPLNRCRKLPSE